MRFNLLPHRKMSRDLAWRVFARQAWVVACVAVMIGLVGKLVIRSSIATEIEFARELTDAIKLMVPQNEGSLELERKYQQMVLRQNIIEELDARRSTSVLILNDLADALPREVYLLRVAEDGVAFSVEGRSVDPTAIARFLDRLSSSAYLQGITLGEIRLQEQDATTGYHFTITGKVSLAKASSQQPTAQGALQ